MPQLTVTDTLTAANNIPSRPGRKMLILRNTGDATVFLGWETTTSATAGADQGLPLEAGEFLSFGGRDLDLQSDLKLVCATGETTTVNYIDRA